MEIGVRVSGISCHGSAPDRGSNAIYRIAPIILEVEALHHRLRSDSALGKGSITATDIRSTAPSLCAVADSATLHLDRRLTEGETRESALAEVRDLPAVKAAAADVFVPEYRGIAYTGLPLTAESYFPPWLMHRDHPLVKTAVHTYGCQFGEEARLGLWQFSTNGVITCGECGIPTIGFGPGEETHAHTTDDQVRVDDLVKSMEFYAAFVLALAST
jgi:putative selenium metabolism hydrolase